MGLQVAKSRSSHEELRSISISWISNRNRAGSALKKPSPFVRMPASLVRIKPFCS
jgi:hypothetical protein